MEEVFSVFFDIWSANFRHFHKLCDHGWAWYTSKSDGVSWSVAGKSAFVHSVYTSSGQSMKLKSLYKMCLNGYVDIGHQMFKEWMVLSFILDKYHQLLDKSVCLVLHIQWIKWNYGQHWIFFPFFSCWVISYFSYLGEREGNPFVFGGMYQVENGSSILHIYTTAQRSFAIVRPLLLGCLWYCIYHC